MIARVGSLAALVVTAIFTGSGTAADPALDSYRIAEAERLDQIARQLDLNYRLIWQSGFGYRYPNPFEPWPRVPLDIWGYPSPRPIEHPIGYESKQTGPNRWIYRPIYAAELQAAHAPAPPLPVPAEAPRGAVAPPKPRPSDLDDRDAKPQPSGPREF